MKKIIILIFLLFMSVFVYSQSHKYTKIKLKTYNNLLFTKVTFNGVKCWLLIDSGASKSLLDINKTEKYKFSYIPIKDTTRKYIGLGGITDIYIVFDYKIDEYHVTFLGTDLYYVNKYLNKKNIDIIGIIGGDFLSNHNAYIDYKKKTLYIK